MENKKRNSVATVLLTIVCILWMYPIVLILINSLKKEVAITTSGVFSLPTSETWNGVANFVASVTQMDFLKSFWYSLVISVMSVVLIMLCCSMAAWYIVRVNGKLSKMFYYLCVFSMVVPFQMVMFTLAKTADTLHLNNPYNICIIYLGFGAGLAVFMFTGFVKGIPLEIEEAALIDGCSPLQVFFKVLIPILKPTIISTAILELMWVWNDYLLPTLVLDIKKYKAILDADKEKLNAANMSVVKTLVSDGKVDEATDYVDVVDNLDLTYDEFMALSDEEKMAYLSGTSNWLTTLYPNVEMEEGIYEITVPLGVDMSATYNVTVSGSVETDSSETINVTIDQQQIVLANAQKFEIDNMSLSLDRDETKIEDKFGSGKFAFGYNKDEKIFLNSVIKNGESEMKYGASIDVSSISIQCKVTTQLEQNLAVTSSVKLEKSNNVDMKNWSAVRVEEEKENLDQVYWEMDPLYRESSMKKAEIFIADGISLTQILEILMRLAQYI